METKRCMFADAQIMANGPDTLCRFYYRLQGEKEQHFVDNPDAGWLLDFVSEDKPYVLVDSYYNAYPWREAFYCAVALESKPLIESALKASTTISDDDLCKIFESVIEKYDSRLAKAWLIDSEQFLNYITIPAKKVWKWEGE